MWERSSFPHAYLHVDGDSFFAACEVARNPHLKGKPVVTGKERGIASAMTYEAKARGVVRGMQVSEILRVCPDAVILPSDYETYSLYARRMYDIVRRYTPAVEEYSIDECFADLTGLRRPLRMSYAEMAAAIKRDLDTELGMTFSLGLAPTKVLAKIASKREKPSGCTVVPSKMVSEVLASVSLKEVWGIGPQTEALLAKYNIHTAQAFARASEAWVRRITAKPQWEIWKELNGDVVYEIDTAPKRTYDSISKTKTFTPPSKDRAFVFAQLSKNVENACIKARRHGYVACEVTIMLKTQSFLRFGRTMRFSQPVCVPQEIIRSAREHFEILFQSGVAYRATGVVLSKLERVETEQLDLFGTHDRIARITAVYGQVDQLAHKYGKHTVFLGSSLAAMVQPSHAGERGVVAERSAEPLRGETKRRRLNIPLLGEAE